MHSYINNYEGPLSLPTLHSQGPKDHSECHMVQHSHLTEGWEEQQVVKPCIQVLMAPGKVHSTWNRRCMIAGERLGELDVVEGIL